MTIGDTVHLALRNLNQAKLRTALTVLGVSIGIASLAGMVSLGIGLQDQFVGRFMKSGGTALRAVLRASALTPTARRASYALAAGCQTPPVSCPDDPWS